MKGIPSPFLMKTALSIFIIINILLSCKNGDLLNDIETTLVLHLSKSDTKVNINMLFGYWRNINKGDNYMLVSYNFLD